MHNKETIELSKYRIQTAFETLDTATTLFDIGKYKDCNNRCYYAIFHSLRAVLALEQIDYSKHSGVIQHFQRFYIKEQIFPVSISKMITEASLIRNQSDYSDFFIASKEKTEEQLKNSNYICNAIREYLTEIYDNEEN